MRIVDRSTLVEGGEDPVVDATHVVDELLLPKRATARDTVGPDEVAADAGVMPVVEANHHHVVGVERYALVVFGKYLSSGSDEQIGA